MRPGARVSAAAAAAGDAGARVYDELKCVNLASVWGNFRAAGARFVVVAAVVESTVQRQRYAESLAGCDLVVVGLTADVDTIRGRLRRRDTGPRLERHLRALAQPASVPVEPAVADFTITNDGTPARVAADILTHLGWADEPGRDDVDPA